MKKSTHLILILLMLFGGKARAEVSTGTLEQNPEFSFIKHCSQEY